jgi:hypothetical protein
MKKVNFKKVLMALTIAMTFLFLGVEQASAQSSTLSGTAFPGANKAVMAPPQGNFVSVGQANPLIEAKLMEIKADLNTPGLPQSAITALEKKFRYFELIDEQLKSGSSIPMAIVNALSMVSPDEIGLPQSVALALKQEAVDLLTI